jgi:enterochelin esterase family protein
MRAIAGLSMGGNEALMTGLNHLDLFAWVGSFSAGGINTNYTTAFPALNDKTAEKLRLLWIACGKDDRLIESNRQFCGWLNTENVHYIWIESGGGHTFLNWRRYLCQFAPLLFQDQKHRPFE